MHACKQTMVTVNNGHNRIDWLGSIFIYLLVNILQW